MAERAELPCPTAIRQNCLPFVLAPFASPLGVSFRRARERRSPRVILSGIAITQSNDSCHPKNLAGGSDAYRGAK